MHAPAAHATAMSDTLSPAAPTEIGRLGPFAVASDGTLSFNDATEPRFGFRWRGRRIAARICEGRRLALSVVAGHVPFTAECAENRARVIAAVAALREALPAGWRLHLAPDHSVQLETDALLGAPPTATKLVGAATSFVLALAPCLDLLEEAGARNA